MYIYKYIGIYVMDSGYQNITLFSQNRIYFPSWAPFHRKADYIFFSLPAELSHFSYLDLMGVNSGNLRTLPLSFLSLGVEAERWLREGHLSWPGLWSPAPVLLGWWHCTGPSLGPLCPWPYGALLFLYSQNGLGFDRMGCHTPRTPEEIGKWDEDGHDGAQGL